MNKKKTSKKINLILTAVALIIVVSILLIFLQERINLREYDANLKNEIESIGETVDNYDKKWSETQKQYDKAILSKAASMAFIVNNFNDVSFVNLNKFCELFDTENILIVNTDGEILAKAKKTQADFSKRRFNQLKECFKYDGEAGPIDVTYLDGESLLYYSAPIDENTMVVIEEKRDDLEELVDKYASWESVLNGITVGDTGNVAVVSGQSYEIKYHTNKNLIGQDGLALGLRAEQMSDGYIGWVNLNRHKYYTGVLFKDGDYILCMIPKTEIDTNIFTISFVVVFIFITLITVMVMYSILVMSDENQNKMKMLKLFSSKYYFNLTLAARLGVISIVGVIFIFYATIYIQTVFRLSKYSISNDTRIGAVESEITEKENYIDKKTYMEQILLNKCTIAKNIIEHNEKVLEPENLDNLKTALMVDGLNVFNKNGVIIASTDGHIGYRLLPEDNPYEADFENILKSNGKYITDAIYDDNDETYYRYAGASLYNTQTGISGFVRLNEMANGFDSAMTKTSLDTILDAVVSDVETVGFAIDKETGLIAYAPDDRILGRLAADYGFDENKVYEGFGGYIEVQGIKYFANCAETKNYYIYIASPINNLIHNQTIIAAMATMICAIAVIIVLVYICLGRKNIIETENEKTIEDSNSEIIELRKNIVDYQTVAKRFGKKTRKTDEMTPEQQVFALFEDIISLVAIAITGVIIITSLLGTEKKTILGYIYKGKWESGINIFSGTAVFIAICVGWVIEIVLGWLLKLLANNLGARGTTICRMLRSASKYIIAIIILFYCLGLLGANPSTLIASAGVLTAVIGFGANSLMADILAGIFIIFEGEFQVGDIVLLDGWRGVVLDIGIRTTKIEDDAHNIKIISNSKVSGIINMTKHPTIVMNEYSIDYGESIERIEKILDEELPLIKETVPTIISGPTYMKVEDFGDNAVIIRIDYEVLEENRMQTNRNFNRELKLIFDRHNINIPYPQITINNPIDYKNGSRD